VNVKALPVLILIALLATACQSASSPDAVMPPAGDILIGSDLPLTVPGSDAPSLERAIQLAINQHPTVGRFKLAYWSLDDTLARAPFAEKAAQNVERLIAEPKVMGIIGPSTSFVAFTVIPVANQAGLVVISPNNTNACLTLAITSCGSQARTLRPTGQNNFFRIAPPDHLQGRSMARFAARTLGVSSVAVINQLGADGELYIDSFEQELARQGGSLVLRDNVDEATTDFTTCE